MFPYPLNLKATTYNHAASAFVATCAEALGWHTPRTDRMTPGCCLPFAAAMWVIDRVHDHTAHGRANTAPTHRAGLADGPQAVLRIAHFAQCRLAIDMHFADFARAQPQLRIAALTSQQLHGSTC